MRSVIAIAIAVGCVGCGSAVDGGESGAPPYAGPLSAAAAVDALECDGRKPWWRSAGDYDSGLEEVGSSPEDALDELIDAVGFSYRAPVEGYRVERREEHRALLSYDVDERTKIALVVKDGIRDYKDNVGWGVVASARCDPAEYPAEVTDDLDIGIWSDGSGRRVPYTSIHSYPGPDHCSWTDITFLLMGPDKRKADWYVRDTSGELSDWLIGKFDGDATLPTGATSTGWHRDGRELWLAADKTAAYLVDRDERDDVERWPAATEPILCA